MRLSFILTSSFNPIFIFGFLPYLSFLFPSFLLPSLSSHPTTIFHSLLLILINLSVVVVFSFTSFTSPFPVHLLFFLLFMSLKFRPLSEFCFSLWLVRCTSLLSSSSLLNPDSWSSNIRYT